MNNNTILSRITENTCTGCGGCRNACPKNAISMGLTSEGFVYPFVDDTICVRCGKCITFCPVIQQDLRNNIFAPAPFAVRCGNEIRQRSSSGGVFSLLANYVLDKRGCVFGVQFDKDMHVVFAMAETKDALNTMRGSKYIQCDVGWVYRDVKTELEKNRYVLFTGCPCQVAALYRYLGKDYERLYTADIICHGVPSQNIFNRYLAEVANGRTVTNVQFRDKQYGWLCTKIRIEFDNGEVYENDWADDAYEIGFHKNIFLRKSCAECRFCGFPRQGDITMGDFWQIERFDRNQNDRKGTSLVFFNNDKGRKLFDHAKDRNTRIKEIETSIDQIPNRLFTHCSSNEGRERFFDLIKNHNVIEAIHMVDKKKYDVGIVGIYTCPNFGGAITYYALYKVVKNLGYSVLMIERPWSANHKPENLNCYSTKPYKGYELAPIYADKEAMRELNSNCDKFLVGSDQLFNDFLYRNFDQWCTLDWVEDRKIKLAYAASFGHDHIWSSEETRAKMAYFMRKFDRFSVRESGGIRLANDEFGVKATWVLDPVFLCERKDYEELANNNETENKKLPYLSAYILDPNLNKQKIIKKIASMLKLEIELYSEMNAEAPEIKEALSLGWDIPISMGTVEKRLKSIMNCDFLIADSFHGVCFALIFNKNFIAISNERRGRERLESILGLVGLSDRLHNSDEELTSDMINPIDYRKTNEILEVERRRCLDWLSDALALKYKKASTDYDIYKSYIGILEHKIDELIRNNQKLTHKVEILYRDYDRRYAEINDIEEYLNRISADKKDLIVLVAVKDTPGYFVTDRIRCLWKNIGFKSNLQDKHWFGYVGIYDGRHSTEVLKEDGVANLNMDVGGWAINLSSRSYVSGNEANILVNGTEYAVNKRGLNIVLLSRARKKVIDSACFDTHTKEVVCSRF